jgi:ferric-dicitrate binding protein FerR (iron transport regulator)
MDKNENTEQDIIVSHFHDRADTEGDIPLFLRETNDYKETEKIFSLRKYITFLNGLSSEDQLWRTINRQINPGALFLSWFKYAAIIILSFSFGALLIYFSGISKHESRMASISSPRGQITSLTLFDGSVVWLNSESTIKYSSGFNTKKREVYVEGEAYFEVTHHEKKPFIVNLGNSQVKVHGTSFNVKAYPQSNRIETVLMEGKIEFIANSQSILLNPCERIVLLPQEGTIEKDQVDVEKITAWKKGKYYYSNEKLSTIIGQLQRWYDMEFVFDENELSLYNFTGVINHEKSIQYNLKLIELTNKINVEFKDDKIVIKSK